MADGDALPPPSYDNPRTGLSVVWVMPLLAVIIAAGVVWQTYQERGPLVVVRFPAAEGIEEGTTILKYRDVNVGEVETVEFSDDLNHVNVAIRLERKIAPFVDQQAQFWLVKPEVSTRGITGLNTVLSGIYIEGRWDNIPGPASREFTALTRRPLAAPGEAGTTVILNSKDGRKLSFGAPVLFNGIEVGKIGTPSLSADGLSVSMEAFIAAPHDARLTTATSFWDSSGISLGLGTGGVTVDIDSLAALIEGGISFGTLISGGRTIRAGHVYEVYPSEEEARSNILIGRNQFEAALLLDADVVGLAKGAKVTFRGLQVGEVTEIAGFTAPNENPDFVQLLAAVSINLARLGISESDDAVALKILSDRVAKGLRAQVSAQGLLGRTVSIELVEAPDSAPAVLRTDLTDRPVLPSLPADLDGRTDTLDGLITRVDKLPIEDVMASAINVMDSITELAASTDTRAIPSQAFDLLTDMRALVGSQELSQALSDLQLAAADVRALSKTAVDSTGIKTLLIALERSERIAQDLEAAIQTLPDLSIGAQNLVQTLSDLPLTALTTNTISVVNQAGTLLADEDLARLAPELAQTFASANLALTDLQSNDAIKKLNRAIGGAEALMIDLRGSVGRLDPILTQVDTILTDIDAMPLGQIGQSVERLLVRLDTVLSADGIETIPVTLSDTLIEMRTVLTDLREGGAVASLNATLADARAAFDSVNTAASSLPDLSRQLRSVATQAEKTIAGYSENSRFNRDLNSAIKAANDALGAIRSLARKIERNPSSLITGR